MFSKLEKALFRAEDIIGVTLILVMSGAVLLQVVSRFVLKSPVSYTEELSRFMLIWLTFIGAAMALRENGHFAVDVYSHRLPVRLRHVSKFFIYLIMLAYLGVLMVNGYALLEITAMQTSAALNLSMHYVYLAIPVGAGLMILHCIVTLCNSALGFFGKPPLSTHDQLHGAH